MMALHCSFGHRLRRIVTVLASVLLGGTTAWTGELGEERLTAAETIYGSVVRIERTAQVYDYQTPWSAGRFGGGSGSGFVVGENRIMTNAHVVSNARQLLIRKHNDPAIYPARILFIAHDSDLALLELEDPAAIEATPPLELGEVPSLESDVRVIGYPVGGQRLSVTRGVVSRIDFIVYAHSGIDSHLAIQIDAAINPGNSGGPVLQGDRVVGVAFQGMRGATEGTGYIIPTPVVRRFLADVEDGRYNGCVDLGLTTAHTVNPTLRQALGLPDDNRGVVVTHVAAGGSSDGQLEPGDIVLQIDEHPVASDGRILIDGEWVDLSEAVERKLEGDTAQVSGLRHGTPFERTVVLHPFPPKRIYAVEYEARPAYAVFGGLVFQPLSRNLLAAHQLEQLEIRKVLEDFLREDLHVELPEPVVMTQVLADAVNAEFSGESGLLLSKINGEPVRRMQDLARLLFDPLEAGTLPEFIVIECLGASRPFVLESREIHETQRRVRETYGLAQDYRIPGIGEETPW